MKSTQHWKRELEKILDRGMSDKTWYRLRKCLEQNGVEEKEYSDAFKWIKILIKNNPSGKSKINIFSKAFENDIWRYVLKVVGENKNRDKSITCEDFRKWVTNDSKYVPPNRINNDGKIIGINTIWYRWFRETGLIYEKSRIYYFEQLIPICIKFKIWEAKRSQIKSGEEIIDAEIL